MNQPVQILPTAVAPFRFTVDQFLALCDQGLFDDYAKSELIEGEIVVVNAQHARHARVKSLLMRRLGNALEEMGSPLEAWTEGSVRLSDGSLPEPDILLTTYRGTGVVPVETVALLVEVSDTTQSTDLGRKADLYAEAGVPEYWVVDVSDNRVTMHSDRRSVEGRYEARRIVDLGLPLLAMTVAGLTVETSGLN